MLHERQVQAQRTVRVQQGIQRRRQKLYVATDWKLTLDPANIFTCFTLSFPSSFLNEIMAPW